MFFFRSGGNRGESQKVYHIYQECSMAQKMEPTKVITEDLDIRSLLKSEICRSCFAKYEISLVGAKQ